MARSAKVRLVALLGTLGATAGLAACATTLTTAVLPPPGAQLRALDRLADAGAHSAFEGTYVVTVPTPNGTRSERVTYAQAHQQWLLRVGESEVVIGPPHAGSQVTWACTPHPRECVAESDLGPAAGPGPGSVWVTPDVGLLDGTSLMTTTQGYPITGAALARRHVALAFATGTYAHQPSQCVTITDLARRGRSTLWCTTDHGVVDFWSVGRHVVVLVTFTTDVGPSTFSLPYPTVIPKSAEDRAG